MTLTFGFQLDMVMICSHARFQGHWSLGSEYGTETNGRTDRRMDEGVLILLRVEKILRLLLLLWCASEFECYVLM